MKAYRCKEQLETFFFFQLCVMVWVSFLCGYYSIILYISGYKLFLQEDIKRINKLL
jgi:hypothetical protein